MNAFILTLIFTMERCSTLRDKQTQTKKAEPEGSTITKKNTTTYHQSTSVNPS